MSLIYILSLFVSFVGFGSATFYHHRYFHHNWRTFHFRRWINFSPARLYPQPPVFNANHIRVTYAKSGIGTFPSNFMPPNLTPVGTVHPSRGRNFPNSLNDMNTYNLLPRTKIPLAVNNVPVLPHMRNIVLHLPSREVQVAVPDRQRIPTVPGTITSNDDEEDEQQTMTAPLTSVEPDQKKTCQETGCEMGSECVFENSWICPEEITDIPCRCQKGCRMQFTFIPLGSSTIVDTCGNICSCNSLFEGVNCTQIPCGQQTKDEATPGLVLEHAPIDMSDKGPIRETVPTDMQDKGPLRETVRVDMPDDGPLRETVPTYMQDEGPLRETLPTDMPDKGKIRETVPIHMQNEVPLRETVPTDMPDEGPSRETLPTYMPHEVPLRKTVPSDMPDKGPLRGDVPAVDITGQKTTNTTELSFAQQNFVPTTRFQNQFKIANQISMT